MAKLEPWDVDYVQHLIAEYDCLDASTSKPATRAEALIKKFNESRDQFQRSDLFELAETLLALQSTAVLLQRAPSLRQLYREVVGEKYFSLYTPAPSPPADAQDGSQEKQLLVADLQNVMSHLHWHYMLDPHREAVQRDLTIDVIKWITFYTCIWALAIFANWYWIKTPFISVLSTVVYAGIIGGFVSSLRRVQSVQLDQDSLFNIHTLNNSQYFLWLSPLVGAIFAVVLMLMFMSGLISGPLFPKFELLPNLNTNQPQVVWVFFKLLVPSGSEAYAKLFLWSFVAGFAERFVPDVLDRIIQRGQDAASNISRSDSIKNTPVPPKSSDPKANVVLPAGKPDLDAVTKNGEQGSHADNTETKQEEKLPQEITPSASTPIQPVDQTKGNTKIS